MVSKSTQDSDKIQCIIHAAHKRFSHYGLSKTTMQEIAEDVGLSKASLYYYFPDKESLFHEIVKKEQDAFIQTLHDASLRLKKASDICLFYTKSRCTFFKDLILLSILKNDNYLEIKPKLSALKSRLHEKETAFIQQVLKKGVNEKEFAKMNINQSTELFLDVLHSLRLSIAIKNDFRFIDDESYQKIEHNSIQFCKLFIKSNLLNK